MVSTQTDEKIEGWVCTEIPVGLAYYTETRVDRFSDTFPTPLSVKSGRFVCSGRTDRPYGCIYAAC